MTRWPLLEAHRQIQGWENDPTRVGTVLVHLGPADSRGGHAYLTCTGKLTCTYTRPYEMRLAAEAQRQRVR